MLRVLLKSRNPLRCPSIAWEISEIIELSIINMFEFSQSPYFWPVPVEVTTLPSSWPELPRMVSRINKGRLILVPGYVTPYFRSLRTGILRGCKLSKSDPVYNLRLLVGIPIFEYHIILLYLQTPRTPFLFFFTACGNEVDSRVWVLDRSQGQYVIWSSDEQKVQEG